ncbi:MAG: hypothetical protein QHC89_07105 [Bosea sp. (in: a-proteobacteria)]|nr:hypothetical protein [Bosea sp. (in: a-proteobacteria)]
MAIPALRAAAARPDGYISTADLITAMEEEFEPSSEDAEILDGRQDSKFSQIVRNLVSHRNSSTSIFAKGYADYLEDGRAIKITDAGRAFLDQTPE